MLLFIALFPVVALVLFVYMIDKYQHEPWLQLLRAVAAGALSAILVLFVLNYLAITFEDSPLGALGDAFFNAAIPEEALKLLMLWVVLRSNRYYDEYFDGIVYAACVSLGFAGFENILYVMGSEDGMSVGVSRAITAVPAHFMFGVAMGYYYSLVHFRFHPDERTGMIHKVCVLAVPVLFHGIYDAALMVMDTFFGVNYLFAAVCFIAFIVACIYMTIFTFRKCKHLLSIDQAFLDYQRQRQAEQQRIEQQQAEEYQWQRQWEQIRQQWLRQHGWEQQPDADVIENTQD